MLLPADKLPSGVIEVVAEPTADDFFVIEIVVESSVAMSRRQFNQTNSDALIRVPSLDCVYLFRRAVILANHRSLSASYELWSQRCHPQASHRVPNEYVAPDAQPRFPVTRWCAVPERGDDSAMSTRCEMRPQSGNKSTPAAAVVSKKALSSIG